MFKTANFITLRIKALFKMLKPKYILIYLLIKTYENENSTKFTLHQGKSCNFRILMFNYVIFTIAVGFLEFIFPTKVVKDTHNS